MDRAVFEPASPASAASSLPLELPVRHASLGCACHAAGDDPARTGCRCASRPRTSAVHGSSPPVAPARVRPSGLTCPVLPRGDGCCSVPKGSLPGCLYEQPTLIFNDYTRPFACQVGDATRRDDTP